MAHVSAVLTMAIGVFLAMATPALAWKNGPPNNKVTNSAADCLSPPYSTHDWIAEQALEMLPPDARKWLAPHRLLLLIGTESPDYDRIREDCGVPHRGYNDTGRGRHDLRFDDVGNVTFDLPAARAEEEYGKAAQAFRDGRHGHAAFYLGAAIHYIGDLAQYGHTIKGEAHHADVEEWVGARTPSLTGGGVFERFLQPDGLVARRAYDAVVRTGRVTWSGKPPILPPAEMDRLFSADTAEDGPFAVSIGHSMNAAVNEAADVLFGFYETVVRPGNR